MTAYFKISVEAIESSSFLHKSSKFFWIQVSSFSFKLIKMLFRN